MRIHVIYFSKSGNTKKLAEGIAQELSCSFSSIEEPIEDNIDVLFLGASVYSLGLDKEFISFIENLDSAKIKKVALFSTSWIVENVNAKMAALLKNKDIEVLTKEFYCKGSFTIFNKNRPNQEDVLDAQKFARDVMHLVN